MTFHKDGEYVSKVENMIRVSKEVIKDSQLDNGAIVAANSTKNYYPPTAKNYFYVWPRDASYACIAADIAGIEEVPEKFFGWCLKRAEGFRETGLLYEKYYVNGLKALGRFQPDQTGTLLYSIWHHYNYRDPEVALKFEELIIKSANGLCDRWERDHFNAVTNDLWEERLTFPDLKENFTYSLAACVKGLECANLMIANDRWLKISEQMKERLESHFISGYFVRSYGKLIDKGIDASMLGLVYPFEVYKADDSRIISTVKEIEDRLIINGGVHRYEFDEYDGWMYEEMHRKKGAGAWPLLNFWLSVYYHLKGDKRHAEMYYGWVLDRVDGYIPEQIFNNDIQVSICPLVWSHTMFIIASKFLEYL
ncbi:Glycosyl hydrolases family 15 [uncultured archaeon]|nr:Glycosyl hydrolases family 15 [uncultured archaeon]